MALPSGTRRSGPLGFVPIMLALALAAFAGGGLGLVWQSTGLGQDSAEEAAAEEAEAEDSAPAEE